VCETSPGKLGLSSLKDNNVQKLSCLNPFCCWTYVLPFFFLQLLPRTECSSWSWNADRRRAGPGSLKPSAPHLCSAYQHLVNPHRHAAQVLERPQAKKRGGAQRGRPSQGPSPGLCPPPCQPLRFNSEPQREELTDSGLVVMPPKSYRTGLLPDPSAMQLATE
jgi:hypothetical protein